MNKNYRLLSFRSFFIFSFLSFFEGSPSSGFFFLGGGERLKILYSRRVFYIQIFSLFFIFTLFHFFTFFTFSDFFTFLHFYIFTIFRFFHFFTFLQFFRGHSGRCFFYVGRC